MQAETDKGICEVSRQAEVGNRQAKITSNQVKKVQAKGRDKRKTDRLSGMGRNESRTKGWTVLLVRQKQTSIHCKGRNGKQVCEESGHRERLEWLGLCTAGGTG